MMPHKQPWIGYKGGAVAHAYCDAVYSLSVENRQRMPLSDRIGTYHAPSQPCAWCKAPCNETSPWEIRDRP